MDRINLDIEGDEYWLEGGDFDDMLEAVKAIPGRRYHAEYKLWILPGRPPDLARKLVPFRVMYIDPDSLADSMPRQVAP